MRIWEMIDINTITTNEFKALFTRDFPYLPFYVYGRTYFKDDIVFNDGYFYISLKDENTDDTTVQASWKLYNDNVDNYISDADISRAFTEAKINFNPKLFPKCDEGRMAFCYLAAHYLVIDLNNALNPFSLGGMGLTQSKSVGSVSESYAIPQWIMNDKNLGLYAQTGYGRKYLSLIIPKLHGNIIFTKGYISFG